MGTKLQEKRGLSNNSESPAHKRDFETSSLGNNNSINSSSKLVRDLDKQSINYDRKKNKIVAILPAYNERISIGSMVLKIEKYVDRTIVVDDGSSDGTADIAELAGAELIRHSESRGKGAALRTGFRAANDANIIVTIGSDDQHNPADIPRLILPILAGEADIVNGSRYINGNGKSTPTYRRIGQTILDKATNINSGLGITDTQSGFRAFAARFVSVFGFKSNEFSIESEMLINAANAGLRIKEVEIGARYDIDGSSEHPVSHGLRVLIKVLQDMELRGPLYYFTIPGVVFDIIGIGIGLVFLQDFYHGSRLNFGSMLLMILLTLIGTFMAFSGIVLHSMSRLISESKGGSYIV